MGNIKKCPKCKNQMPHQVQSEYGPVTCSECGGKGWVEVEQDEATLERFRLENDRLRGENEELKAKLEAMETELPPTSDSLFVTN